MIADNRKQVWRDRARWCIEQAIETERTLQPRGECEAKTMAEVSVEFWRGMARDITESLDA